nr:hypothetical protein [Mycoplasmopsis bovis]
MNLHLNKISESSIGKKEVKKISKSYFHIKSKSKGSTSGTTENI